jgi:hypothetical protein
MKIPGACSNVLLGLLSEVLRSPRAGHSGPYYRPLWRQVVVPTGIDLVALGRSKLDSIGALSWRELMKSAFMHGPVGKLLPTAGFYSSLDADADA